MVATRAKKTVKPNRGKKSAKTSANKTSANKTSANKTPANKTPAKTRAKVSTKPSTKASAKASTKSRPRATSKKSKKAATRKPVKSAKARVGKKAKKVSKTTKRPVSAKPMNVDFAATLDSLYSTYTSRKVSARLKADVRTQVTSWRWATESMSFDVPFARELYGGSAPRWLADERADPESHVHHGLDAQDRIVIECSSGGSEQVCLYAPQQRIIVDWDGDGRIDSVSQRHYQDGRLAADYTHCGYRGLDTRYEYDGDRLQRSVTRNWEKGEKPWFCQNVFSYDMDGVLARIDLQYLDEQGQPVPGADRLEYLRLPKGETLKTVEARVQSLLEQALAAAQERIPRTEKLYCLLLCYTEEDLPAAWPPFLVWGRESYRRSVLERGEDVSYYLWAPDEIRGRGNADEYWLEDQALRDACLLHSQLMQMKQGKVSAMRVLKNMVPLIEEMMRQAGFPVTDDFVVAYADNTGEISPLKAMKAHLPAERWALLKERGYV